MQQVVFRRQVQTTLHTIAGMWICSTGFRRLDCCTATMDRCGDCACGSTCADMLTEYGFWDYTTPLAGGMEAFARDDYLLLLDDMAQAGMNSLMVCVKWFTTGYRSRLPFLDQLPGNPVIESDNALLREVIEEAGSRGIKVWLGAVVSIFVADKYGLEPYSVFAQQVVDGGTVRIGVYDSDSPGFAQRAVQIAEELVDLFPGIGGLEVEMEGCGVETPHRIPLYNRWARERGRRPFEELGHPFDARGFDVPEWRDYTTSVRILVLKAIEEAVRARGFQGDLATIHETGKSDYSVSHEVNLAEFARECPNWLCVTYEYAKWRQRDAVMDLSVRQPKQHGLKVFYLPRGVMTWGSPWPLRIALEDNWRYDIEDIQRYRPDGVWWFGSGGINEGAHVSVSRLQSIGYGSGVEARRALLRQAAALNLH